MGYTCGRHLTKELCHGIAMTCSSISEFCRKDNSAYAKSLQNHWIDNWFSRRKHVKYTKEQCFALAKLCHSKTEFQSRYSGAYYAARRNNWLPLYNWFISTAELKSHHRKYTDDEILSVSRKYSTLREFREQAHAWYALSARRHLLSKMTWLLRNVEVIERNRTDTIYAYIFEPMHSVYIGRTVEPRIRDANHRKAGDVVYEFAKLHHITIPSPNILITGISVPEGVIVEDEMITQYKKSGWNVLNKMKGGSIGSLASGKLSKTHCINVAKQYDTIGELFMHNASVYRKLHKCGWIHECPWLKYERMPIKCSDMSKEQLRDIALRYTSRAELMRNAKGIYEYGRKHGWIQEWFPISLRQPKRVAKYSSDGTLVETYPSITQAAKALNLSYEGLRKKCTRGGKLRNTEFYVSFI